MQLLSVAVLAVTVSGTVLSESGPIFGARVTLYGGGTANARALGAATSSHDGTFRIAVPQRVNDVMYVIATGGAPPRRSRPNAALALMAVVPPNAAGRSVVDERSTVASGFALAQFLHGTALTGASPGLANAAATTFDLASPDGSVSPVLASAPNGSATETLATFNTLAGILSTCVADAGLACRALLAAARPPGGAAPANTLEAIVDIAHNPVHAAAVLFRLQPREPPFRPALARAPSAWILALKRTAGGFDAPGRMAFDAAGNVWSTNNFDAAAPAQTPGPAITVLSPTGRPILHSPISGGGIDGAGFGIAIDATKRVWIGNVAGDSISLFSGDGAALSPNRGWIDGRINAPQGLAIDLRGNVWIPNSGLKSISRGSVTEYVGGDHAVARTFTAGGIASPFCIAVDAANNIWIANGGTAGSVSVLRNDGTPLPFSPVTHATMKSLKGIAVDGAGDAWVADFGNRSVFELTPNGTIAAGSPLTPPGMRGPWGVAVDGDDNVWVADFTGENVVELCGRNTAHCPPGVTTGAPLSPGGGFTSAALQHLTAVQIDESGNVWVANNIHTSGAGNGYTGGDGLVELVGLAAPVKTPLIGPPQRP